MNKFVIATILTGSLLVGNYAHAEDFNDGTISYSILKDYAPDGRYVEVSSSWTYNKADTIVVPETVVFNDTVYNVVGLGASAFTNNASKIKSVTLPNSIKYFKEKAFRKVKIETINLPASLDTIEKIESVFDGCVNLKSITVDAENQKFSEIGGVLYNKNQTVLYTYPAAIADSVFVLPETVETIWNSAFMNNTSLNHIKFNDVLSVIQKKAFYGRANLRSIDLGKAPLNTIEESAFYGLQNIKEYDFRHCKFTRIEGKTFYNNGQLSKVWFPECLSVIAGEYSFSGCSNIKEFHIDAKTPPTFDAISGNLSGINNELTTLYVPEGCRDAYVADEVWGSSFLAVEEYLGELLTLDYSYCSDNIADALGDRGAELYFRAAIQIPEDRAKRLVGNKLSAIKIGAAPNPGRDAYVFLSYNLEDEPFYTQEVTLQGDSWNEITLLTPYVVEGKEIFVGYGVTAGNGANVLQRPIGADDSEADAYGDWVAVKKSADAEYQWEHVGESKLTNVTVKAQFSGYTIPVSDAQLKSISFPEYAKTGEEFEVTGVVRNISAKPFSTFDVACSFGEGEPVVFSLDAKEEIAPFKEYKFTIPNLVSNESGKFDVKATISNLNGEEDQYAEDNSCSAEMIISDNLVERKMLIEEFSTAQCGNCPAVHRVIANVLSERDDVVCAVHHVGFGTDQFTINESSQYTWFYGSNSTYAPALMIDRTNLADEGAVNGNGNATVAPVMFANTVDKINSLLDARKKKFTFVSLEMENSVDESARDFNVTVSGVIDPLFEMATVPYLTVFLTEDNLVGYQSNGGQNYVHNHVMRAVLTGIKGDEIKADEDGKFEMSFNYKLGDSWNAANMRVIAFVNEFNSKNQNECQIYNVVESGITGATSVEGIYDDVAVSVVCNGDMVQIHGAYDNASVYGLDGSVIMNNASANFTLASGVYLVKVTANGADTVKKIAIR